MRAVASRLGLHPNAVYTYVADRAALEQAVVERVLAEVADLTCSALRPGEDGAIVPARPGPVPAPGGPPRRA